MSIIPPPIRILNSSQYDENGQSHREIRLTAAFFAFISTTFLTISGILENSLIFGDEQSVKINFILINSAIPPLATLITYFLVVRQKRKWKERKFSEIYVKIDLKFKFTREAILTNINQLEKFEKKEADVNMKNRIKSEISRLKTELIALPQSQLEEYRNSKSNSIDGNEEEVELD